MSEPQRRLGPYRIERKLGEGGMGSVFAARHDSGELVALKVLRREAFLDEVSLQRFEREARLLADLRHPNVVALRDVGVLPGVGHYLALELVEGGSLADRIKRGGPLPEAEAIRVLLGLCSAIGAAHERGVLHRDLKPANVLLREGEPVLTDFGLARRQVASQQLTQTGDVLGTPAFMAPEQTGALDLKVSPATDIYGLGATLYAALTGSPPFRGASVVDVLLRVGTEIPEAPSVVRGERLDPGLEAICLRCLAKHPGDRYPNAFELSAALEALGADPTRSAERSSLALVAVTALVVGLGLGVAGLYLKSPPSLAKATSTPRSSARATSAPSPAAPGQPAAGEALPQIAGVRWFPRALGPPSPSVRRAFARLQALEREVPRGEVVLGTEGPSLEDCANALADLPSETPAERLARVHLWGEVLEWLDPPLTIGPHPPSEAWRLALVQALRWAHAEVALNPRKASALALRGRLWRLLGMRLQEDWRTSQTDRVWGGPLEAAFADLRAALDRAPSSWDRPLLQSTFEGVADCVRGLGATREHPLREDALRLADAFLKAFPERAASHTFRQSFAPRSEHKARRARALSSLSDPSQRAWLSLQGNSADGALVQDDALDSKVRLAALVARVDAGDQDPATCLALAARLVRRAPQPRALRGWRMHLTIKVLKRLVQDGSPAALARGREAFAVVEASAPSYRPTTRARLLGLAVGFHPKLAQAYRLAFLRELEHPSPRLDYVRRLGANQGVEALANLRRLSLATQLDQPAIYPRVLKCAQRHGLSAELDALRQLSEHLRRVDAAKDPDQGVRVAVALRGADIGVRAIVTARVAQRWPQSWPISPLWHQLVDGTLAEFNRWLAQAQGTELVFAHAQRLEFLSAICGGTWLQGVRREGALQALAESATHCADEGARSERPERVRLRAGALTGLALHTPRDHPAHQERSRAARAALEHELQVVGYEPTAMTNLLTLARHREDWPTARRLGRRAARACVPLWPQEATLAQEQATCAALTFDLDRAAKLLDAVFALPGRDPQRYTSLPMYRQLTMLRARVHARVGRAAEALDALNALARAAPPRGDVQLARFLRARAFVARRLGTIKQAVQDLRRALELTPLQHVMISLELSDAYAREGLDDQAESNWNRAVEAISLREHFLALRGLIEAGEIRLATKLMRRLDGQTLTPAEAAAAAQLRADLERLTQ